MVFTADTPHLVMEAGDRIAAAAENPGGLAHGDLGRQELKQLETEVWAPVAVGEAEGLARKLPTAAAAEETGDEAAVALAAVVAFALIAEGAVGPGRAGSMRTARWQKFHLSCPGMGA